MAAGPSAEASMIRKPGKGGVCAICPPVLRRPDRSGRRGGSRPGHERRSLAILGPVSTDALDHALGVFAATAPQYGPYGFANHGPTACEAMANLGRAGAIEGWVTRYGPRLEDAPPPASRSLSETEWPEALGDSTRFPEWLALFERELADRPPTAVVGEWAPRLLPGAVGGGTPGPTPTR